MLMRMMMMMEICGVKNGMKNNIWMWGPSSCIFSRMVNIYLLLFFLCPSIPITMAQSGLPHFKAHNHNPLHVDVLSPSQHDDGDEISIIVPGANGKFQNISAELNNKLQLDLDIQEVVLTNLDLDVPKMRSIMSSHSVYSREDTNFGFSSRNLFDEVVAQGVYLF